VVDRNFGDRIVEIARSCHVWVLESASNTPVVRRLWAAANPLSPRITTFAARDPESAEDACARIAGDVAQHHGEYAHDPPWSEIVVYGVSLDERLREVFGDLGATQFALTQEGFVCRRGG
jgi:hypothetical protein